MVVSHIEVNEDPTKCYNSVETFCEGKTVINKIYNTTPLINGVMANRQANLIVITTCLIQWEATKEEYDSYLFKMQTLIKK